MWVEGGDIHDELLDQLGTVLTEPDAVALVPSAAELEALAAAVAARWPDGATAPVAAPGPVRHLRPTGQRPLRRLGSRAWRAGSVAAGLVVFSASAAAATGGVPLPRPVRVVAYTVGLPVDSPALDDTKQHIEDLKEAAKANDKPKVEATARRLRTDLKKVPGHEKKEAEQKVEAAMASVAPLIAPSTTTTTAPTPPATGAPAPPAPTTATTAEAEERDKAKGTKGTVTSTTDPPTTTTTAPEPTTTTTAPETDETPSDGTPPGDPGTGTGDPGTGDPGTGGGDQGSTTPTTTPDGGTTTTTIPDGGGAPGGGDPGSTTTTTSSTTTTTMPPADPGAGTQP
ncbi:MAG TPA: hypothetical protein VFS16_14510 [Acidimicrobiia bacterium]|nr:hypothetical protein [Acidimicrobiia bacterium]